ncbi:hypothetical protein Hdeb2414_s0022g00617011 [Helianthus debilis subsp. tardiflorus]
MKISGFYHLVPLPGSRMALTTRNLVISAQLSAIAGQLDAILATMKDDIAAMKDDVAAIKTQMIRDGTYCEESDEDRKNTVMENSLMANKRDEMVNSDNRKGHHQILEIKADKPYLPAIPKPLQPTPKIPPRISDFDKHMRFLTCKLLESGGRKRNTNCEQPPVIEGDTHDKKEIAEIKRAIKRSSKWCLDAKHKKIARSSQSMLAYGWVYEAGQPTIEWLIAWHNSQQIPDCRLEDKSVFRRAVLIRFQQSPINTTGPLTQLQPIPSQGPSQTQSRKQLMRIRAGG